MRWGQMNWLVSENEELSATASSWQKVSQTISYFVLRLNPLLGSGCAFVACNRIGTERVRGAASESTFTGSSCLVSLAECVVMQSF